MANRKGKRMQAAEMVTPTDRIVVPRALPKRRVEDIPEPPRARWIAVITIPNREIDANRSIRDARFWTFYPQRLVPVRHARTVDHRAIAYLPGYVFAHMLPRQDWTVLEDKPGVLRVLMGRDGNPVLLPDRDVASLMAIATPDGLIKDPPKPAALRVIFDVGERVKIVEGPFASFHAVVTDGVDTDGYLGVDADVFRGPTPMRLPAGWVKRVA